MQQDEILREIKLSLARGNVIELIKDLSKHYDISINDIISAHAQQASRAPELKPEPEPEPKTKQWPRFGAGPWTRQTVSQASSSQDDYPRIQVYKNIGVILPSGKLLYYDGSQNMGTRSMAMQYIRNLPKGYNWHLMTRSEAEEIKQHFETVNSLLRSINGLPIYANQNYLLADDNSSKGYVRYLADM